MSNNKFAFIVHAKNDYRSDFRDHVFRPLGLLPDRFYRFVLKNRPLRPYLWSEVTVTPGATEAEGYIIMLPYTGRQLLQQQKLMLPRIKQSIDIAVKLNATVVGLGALTSPVTFGGRSLTNDKRIGITNGNSFTAVITCNRIQQFINSFPGGKPVVALVGATGSVGSLVAKLLAQQNTKGEYVMIARNHRKLTNLTKTLYELNPGFNTSYSVDMKTVKNADLVVLLTSAHDSLLHSEHLKPGAVILDDTLPRNTHPDLLVQRPDVKMIDGGLVSLPHLKFTKGIELPEGTSFACLAETILLARAGHQDHFSIGNPTLEQAGFISKLADDSAHLGFGVAPDHSFGIKTQPGITAKHASEEITKVVIIGGGYVSVWAYRSLLKNLRREILSGKVKITIVSPYDYHSFHGWSAEGLTGIIQNANRRSPLAEVVSRAKIVKAHAEEIDTETKMIRIRPAFGELETLQYDHLLFGFGSNDADTVEGIKEYGYRVKSPEEFEIAYNRIPELVKRASGCLKDEAGNFLNFVVAGAGITGIELSLNLDEYVEVLKKQYPLLKDVQHSVTLINSAEKVLSTLDPKFRRTRKYVEKQLLQSNVRVINNVRLRKIINTGAYLNDGTFVNSLMVISTIGQSRFIIKGSEMMERDAVQRLRTDEFFRIPNHANIWGGGDSCNVPYRQTNAACISDALWAIKHGKYAGENIARAIKNKPLKPFRYRGLGQAASLGMGKGVGDLYGIEFTGILAWILRWFFFNYFMPSKKVMLQVIADWWFLLIKGQRKGIYLYKKALLLQDHNNSYGKLKGNDAVIPILTPGVCKTSQGLTIANNN